MRRPQPPAQSFFWRRKNMFRLSLVVVALASFVLACGDIMPGWK
jgi:hypothetical protein